MGKEIERKFLVKGDAWKALAPGIRYRQGYLNSSFDRTVRVRTIGDQGFITVKGPNNGIARLEFEYVIPADDANEMLTELAEKPLIEKYGGVTAEGIVESALEKVSMIEQMGYDNLVISIKSSDVLMCVKAHELISKKTDYPLHVGITESGTLTSGNIKSAVGLGIILHEGIGDTIRVSLTGDPVEEIKSAKLILKTLGLRRGGVEVVSCPTCGRTKIDLIGLANQVENMVTEFDQLDVKVAVMGCVVNGPGEAKEADLGIAGGCGEGLLIRKGEVIRKLPEDELLSALHAELVALAKEQGKL